jgi:tryptophan synthase alpha chain
LGVTGVRNEFANNIKEFVVLAKKYAKVPVYVGFGIYASWQAKNISQFADGVIIGSAIVKIIAEHKENSAKEVKKYIKLMKESI